MAQSVADDPRYRRLLTKLLTDVGLFSRYVAGRSLRPYQLEPARAILDSVLHRKGLTFTVMMARQAGKNELSAQLELYLLNIFQRAGGNIVKCAPTFKPQIVNSKLRLEQALGNRWNAGLWGSSPPAAGGGRGPGREPGEVRQGVPAHGRHHQRHHRPVRHRLDRRHPAGGAEADEPGPGGPGRGAPPLPVRLATGGGLQSGLRPLCL